MIVVFWLYCVYTLVVVSCDRSLFAVYKMFRHDEGCMVNFMMMIV